MLIRPTVQTLFYFMQFSILIYTVKQRQNNEASGLAPLDNQTSIALLFPNHLHLACYKHQFWIKIGRLLSVTLT